MRTRRSPNPRWRRRRSHSASPSTCARRNDDHAPLFGPRRADLTTEACLAHWRGKHSAIGARLPGVRAYVQNHGVLANGRFLLPYPGFDIMPELDWDDLAAMDAAIDSQVHERDSVDDEANFIDVTRTGYAVTARHVLSDRQPKAGAVKLITLIRRAANATMV